MTQRTRPSSTSLRIRRRRPGAALQLVCFPHAGGTASFFRDWSDLLPDAVEVVALQYPGREDRLAEPLLRTMEELADHLAEDLASLAGPLALFGHSLGASVAYETARRLDRTRPGCVRQLVASGRPAPSLTGTRTAARTDEELWAELNQLGGTAKLVLESEELRALVLPALRNDFALADRYRSLASPQLNVAVMALVGDADPDVTPEQARAWQEVTTGEFAFHVLPGDHFYLIPRRQQVAALILDRLAIPDRHWPSFP